MRPRTWTTRLATLLLAVGTIGTVACGSGEPSTDAERLARGRELVAQMSAKLAAATHASTTTTEIRDVVRGSRAKEQVSRTGEYAVRRPDRFHAKASGSRPFEMWYDGQRVIAADHEQKVFAEAPMPETIDRTLDALAERFAMPLPLGDLFYSSAEQALLSETTTGGYVDRQAVEGVQCHHLAFRDKGVDWELWLPVEGEPLPKRFRVVQTQRTGQPVIDLTFKTWDLTTPAAEGRFVASIPADYEGIAILQTAAAVKNSADVAPPADPATKK